MFDNNLVQPGPSVINKFYHSAVMLRKVPTLIGKNLSNGLHHSILVLYLRVKWKLGIIWKLFMRFATGVVDRLSKSKEKIAKLGAIKDLQS